jgi:hypothetical protein
MWVPAGLPPNLILLLAISLPDGCALAAVAVRDKPRDDKTSDAESDV